MTESPVRYKLIGLLGEDVPSSYYTKDLIKSAEDPSNKTHWLVRPDKYWAEKTEKGVLKVFVHWLFYPSEYGQWIPKANLTSAARANELTRRRRRRKK